MPFDEFTHNAGKAKKQNGCVQHDMSAAIFQNFVLLLNCKIRFMLHYSSLPQPKATQSTQFTFSKVLNFGKAFTAIIFLLLSFTFAQDSIPEQEFQGYVALPEPLAVFNEQNVRITAPEVLMSGTTGSYQIELLDPAQQDRKELPAIIDGKERIIALKDGKGSFDYAAKKGVKDFILTLDNYETRIQVHPLPGWLAIVPPLIAILLALIFRQVIVALFVGILSGTIILAAYKSNFLAGIFSGFLATISDYILPALADPDHASIILFTLLIGGMVALVSRNGGMQGVVNRISRLAKSPRSAQMSTWGLGLAIFFDDYANSLVVGNTMRPITDSKRISREKLAYIVDSTAAPVSALAFITTWIGVELGYIDDALGTIGGPLAENHSAYSVFLNSLPYAFYPILALLFIVMVVWSGRDFGPMLRAERRARTTGQVSLDHSKDGDAHPSGGEDLSMKADVKPRAFNAVLPVLTLIVGVALGLVITGFDGLRADMASDGIMLSEQASNGTVWNTMNEWKGKEMGSFGKLGLLIGAANSYAALMWASLAAVLFAILLSVSQSIFNLTEAADTLVTGFKAMLPALVILVLAWALASLTKEMKTADWLAGVVQNNIQSQDGLETLAMWLPAIIFVVAAAVAFATGSSWGTMAILYPALLPLMWEISQSAGLEQGVAFALIFNAVSCVLAGSVFGDHCSPISDTTVLSSLASDCNHIDHVRTQLPYALTVGVVAIFGGTLPAAYGISAWICYPVALLLLFGVLMVLGGKADRELD
jgi:Na+/H+ antiporter NhaC